MNLLQALRRTDSAPDEQRYTVDDYAGWLNEWAYNGSWYPITQANPPGNVQQSITSEPAEQITHDFCGYAGAAYQSNGVVFACMLVRQLVFSAVRFQWQRLAQGRPSEMFGTPDLSILENPWPGGTTQDLLVRMIQDADLAGNAYHVIDTSLPRIGGDGGRELVRLRPDWVGIVLEPRRYQGSSMGYRRKGYAYQEGGFNSSEDPVAFLPGEVSHFAPIPDPLARYRGMSWLTPIIREVQSDQLMGRHKRKFFENAATPNMIIKYPPEVRPEAAAKFKAMLDREHAGAENAYKRLHIGMGADVTVVGSNFEQMDFKSVQGHGETRIAAAAGVPPVVVGLSEGLASATYSNYAQARRRLADGTCHPLWQNAAGSLQTLIAPVPAGAVRLWYDARDVPFLREDEKDAAVILETHARTIRTLVDGGYTPDSAMRVVLSGDLGLLQHTGLFSVQLQAPGAGQEGEQVSEDDTRSLVEMIQKIYLGVGTVMSADEARTLLNRAGADLPIPGPVQPAPPPVPTAGGQPNA